MTRQILQARKSDPYGVIEHMQLDKAYIRSVKQV